MDPQGYRSNINKLPGIASSLKKELLEIRVLKKDWAYVAALHASDFVERPATGAFEGLKKSSEKAKVWPQVREAMLRFLETGERPSKTQSDWPLPDTGIESLNVSRAEKSQHAEVLIDIAISEKKTEDVLKWFEIYKKKETILEIALRMMWRLRLYRNFPASLWLFGKNWLRNTSP